MQLKALLDVAKATAEESRIRILSVLRHGELTVTDLTEILGQSQPRVSRHLRVLVEAGVVTKQREGTRSFFRCVDHSDRAQLVGAVLAAVDDDDPVVSADRARLEAVRARRINVASDYFERIAPIWDQERSLHASSEAVEAAVVDLVGDRPTHTVLDVGTGTGRMLQLFADRAVRVVGLDSSHSMLAIARANLEQLGATGWELRQGDVYSPPLERSSFDLVVVHQVLHYLEDPGRALVEAGRLLAPDGRMIVVDFAPHQHEFLRQAAHRRLGFAHEYLDQLFDQAGLDCTRVIDIEPPTDIDGLTVTVWLAHDRRLIEQIA